MKKYNAGLSIEPAVRANRVLKQAQAVLLSLFLVFVFSCKTTADRQDVPPDDPLAQAVLPPIPAFEDEGEGIEEESPAGSAGELPLPDPPGPQDDNPSETRFAGEPDLADIGGLPEPFADLPETEREDLPPGETSFAAALPEPAAPILPEPQPAAQIPPPPVSPAVQPPPVSPPAPAPPSTPSPPPFIRPAEEAPDPAPARTPVPSPPAPPAEPPAWTRQNQAESRPPPPQAVPVEPRPASPPASSAEPPSPVEEEGIDFSRTVRATVGQLVEIPFRGTGWVYLGETGSRQGLVYGSRRLDPEGQSFIFRAEAAGTYSLKFYKQDFVRDYILNDYVRVIVGESPEAAATGWFNPATDRGRAIAEPRWPTVAEEAEAFRRSAGTGRADPAGGTPAVQGQVPALEPGTPASLAESALAGSGLEGSAPAGQTTEGREGPVSGSPAAGPVSFPATGPAALPAPPPPPAVEPRTSPEPGSLVSPAETLPEGDTPDQYLRRAREEFEAGRVAPALALLDRFRERYPAGSDETWWLYGQFYEANSPSRDIRSSLDYYRRLLREYPQSSRCNEARRRIAYLERYYINIR